MYYNQAQHATAPLFTALMERVRVATPHSADLFPVDTTRQLPQPKPGGSTTTSCAGPSQYFWAQEAEDSKARDYSDRCAVLHSAGHTLELERRPPYTQRGVACRCAPAITLPCPLGQLLPAVPASKRMYLQSDARSTLHWPAGHSRTPNPNQQP